MQRQQAPEGFTTTDGRLVYSILFTLESSPPKSLQLVVPLDANGNARNGRCRSAESGKRVVEVFPGQSLRFNHKKFAVTAVEAYRWTKDGVAFGWP